MNETRAVIEAYFRAFNADDTAAMLDCLAEDVAHQLHAHDALAAHARDELGISEVVVARPLLAAEPKRLSCGRQSISVCYQNAFWRR